MKIHWKRNYSRLNEFCIESMNVRFKMGMLGLKGIELSGVGIVGPPRRKNNGVLRDIQNDIIIWGCFDDLSLAYAMVVENRWVRRRKKTTRVKEDEWGEVVRPGCWQWWLPLWREAAVLSDTGEVGGSRRGRGRRRSMKTKVTACSRGGHHESWSTSNRVLFQDKPTLDFMVENVL